MRAIAWVLAIVGLAAASGLAQQTGQVLGVVSDELKGPLPGVTVRLAGPAASKPRAMPTDPNGAFRFDNVLAGTYTVLFELQGFSSVKREVAVAAGRAAEMNVSLALAAFGAPVKVMPEQFILVDTTLGILVRVETTLGTFVLGLADRRAPQTVANFLKYVDGGFYTGGRFHRATRSDNYTPAPPDRPMMHIIQGGINPDRAKEAAAFVPVPLERTTTTGLKHVAGVVSMARGSQADSGRSDFFILLDDQPSMDVGGKRYPDGEGFAAFGRVIEGLDVVRRINQQPVQGQALTPPVPIQNITRVR